VLWRWNYPDLANQPETDCFGRGLRRFLQMSGTTSLQTETCSQQHFEARYQTQELQAGLLSHACPAAWLR
jgi:hypothetical protein